MRSLISAKSKIKHKTIKKGKYTENILKLYIIIFGY